MTKIQENADWTSSLGDETAVLLNEVYPRAK